MTAINDFLAMGGYAAYVWPAFAVAAVVLVTLAIASRRRLKANEAQVRDLEAAKSKGSR